MLQVNTIVVIVHDGAEFKNKLMGVIVYFKPAEKINNQTRERIIRL
jgi:hypothetical protein